MLTLSTYLKLYKGVVSPSLDTLDFLLAELRLRFVAALLDRVTRLLRLFWTGLQGSSQLLLLCVFPLNSNMVSELRA
jgi:hypothetical protein